MVARWIMLGKPAMAKACRSEQIDVVGSMARIQTLLIPSWFIHQLAIFEVGLIPGKQTSLTIFDRSALQP